MKKIERKIVSAPTTYTSPKMLVIVMATQEHILQVSGSDINDAGEETDDIFGE